jgi:hypothetical protein
MAIEKLSLASAKNEILFLFIAQSINGVHARGAPRGEKSRQHAGHDRDQQ